MLCTVMYCHVLMSIDELIQQASHLNYPRDTKVMLEGFWLTLDMN